MFNITAKNLDKIYVVCKKERGNFFFYRSGYSKTDSSVTYATTFEDIAQATQVAIDWSTKQNKKFKVEPLSKFMVNNFTMEWDAYTTNGGINIRSNTIPFHLLKHKEANQDLEKYRAKIDVKFASAISDAERDIRHRREGILDAERDYHRKVQGYNEEIVKLEAKKAELSSKREEFKNTTVNDLIEPLITKSDRNMKVLYGKKETTPTTLHQQDSTGFQVMRPILMARLPDDDDSIPF